MRIVEFLTEANQLFYHGSMEYLPVGTILIPNLNYEFSWGDTDFYKPLENYKPKGMLSHKEAVFMVDNDNNLDVAGGGTEWVFRVEPLGPVQKHDLNWSSEISMIVGDYKEADREEKFKTAAENYWNGIPHPNESVWEYLTPKARIVSVEEF